MWVIPLSQIMNCLVSSYFSAQAVSSSHRCMQTCQRKNCYTDGKPIHHDKVVVSVCNRQALTFLIRYYRGMQGWILLQKQPLSYPNVCALVTLPTEYPVSLTNTPSFASSFRVTMVCGGALMTSPACQSIISGWRMCQKGGCLIKFNNIGSQSFTTNAQKHCFKC